MDDNDLRAPVPLVFDDPRWMLMVARIDEAMAKHNHLETIQRIHGERLAAQEMHVTDAIARLADIDTRHRAQLAEQTMELKAVLTVITKRMEAMSEDLKTWQIIRGLVVKALIGFGAIGAALLTILQIIHEAIDLRPPTSPH